MRNHEKQIHVHVHIAELAELFTFSEKLCELKHIGAKTMSDIKNFADRQNAANDKMDAAVAGIAEDVKALSDTVKQLQESAGKVTPEDQKLLDDLEARAQGLTDKLEALDKENPAEPQEPQEPAEGENADNSDENNGEANPVL